MKSAFFKERKKYTKNDLSNALNISILEATDILRKLKSYGVVKNIKSNLPNLAINFSNVDVEIGDVEISQPDQLFVFDYVGVLTVDNYIFKCYPKYVSDETKSLSSLKTVLQVIQKYNAYEQIITMTTDLDRSNEYNKLAIMLYLIRDFIEYGSYSNHNEIRELNGEGEINWDETINNLFPIIKNNKPYYFDVQTTIQVDNEYDFFKRLHKAIVTDCSRRIEESDLAELFNLDNIYATDELIEEFGSYDYILDRLVKEMNVQYVTRKQLVLRGMYAYISSESTNNSTFGLSVYGTNSFHVVWEKVCSNVLGNRLSVSLKDLPIELSEVYILKKNETLLSIIKKPKWSAFIETKKVSFESEKTLNPDIITIYKREDGICFGIFDAKYYDIYLGENGLYNNPGVEDVTKQFLYNVAYSNFILEHNFTTVRNAFLFPTDKADGELIGDVELPFLQLAVKNKLENIIIVKLPAEKMFYWYLNEIEIEILDEFKFL